MTDEAKMLGPFSALIIGPSGHGKTWVGSTVPPPRLIVDLEGRARYTPNGRGATYWDGLSDPMKLPRSKTRTYIVNITGPTAVQVLNSIRAWLRSGKHPFVSLDMDSLMEMQMRTSDEIRPGTAALQTQDWGTLLRTLQSFVREVHDFTRIPETGLKVAVFIAGVKDDNGYKRPMMQGQIGSQLPYFMDIVGYLEKTRDQEGVLHRSLWIDQRPQNDLEVKDGTDIVQQTFGPCIENPNLEAFYEALLAANEGGK